MRNRAAPNGVAVGWRVNACREYEIVWASQEVLLESLQQWCCEW